MNVGDKNGQFYHQHSTWAMLHGQFLSPTFIINILERSKLKKARWIYKSIYKTSNLLNYNFHMRDCNWFILKVTLFTGLQEQFTRPYAESLLRWLRPDCYTCNDKRYIWSVQADSRQKSLVKLYVRKVVLGIHTICWDLI